MKLKLDADGKPVLENGKLVFEKDDGSTLAVDVGALYGSVASLREESRTHRLRAEKAEESLKAFEGLDPEKAREAVGVVSKLDQKKLIDAGKVDEVRNEITKAYDEKLKAADTAREKAELALHNEMIGGAFARSKFIADRLAVPADMVKAAFAGAFKIEDGKVVAYDSKGAKIYSRANPGELADFDEAIGSLVDSYPHKDSILKAEHRGGAGAPPNKGTQPNGQGGKQLTRAQFDAMDPAHRQAHMRSGGTVTD